MRFVLAEGEGRGRGNRGGGRTKRKERRVERIKYTGGGGEAVFVRAGYKKATEGVDVARIARLRGKTGGCIGFDG